MSGPLTGKVALVTGASRGIGAAIAERFAREGARVVLASRALPELERVAGRIGAGALARRLDVTDPGAVDALLKDVVLHLGGLHLVVNDAGLSERETASRGGDEWWDRMIRVNLTGAFYVCRAALAHLGHSGRIVNVASVLGVFGIGDSAAYVAAKHGLVGLTRALADEVAARGITVNAVCPGWVDTEMAERGFRHIAERAGSDPSTVRKGALSRIPTGRIVTPVEVASLVALLCRPDAGAIHGQAVRIDGGATPW